MLLLLRAWPRRTAPPRPARSGRCAPRGSRWRRAAAPSVEVGAREPRAVPRRARAGPRTQPSAASCQRCARAASPRARAMRREVRHHGAEEEAEPHRLAAATWSPTRFMPSFQSPLPIKRQAVDAHAQAAVDRAGRHVRTRSPPACSTARRLVEVLGALGDLAAPSMKGHTRSSSRVCVAGDRAWWCAHACGSHSRSSLKWVRTPAPPGGCATSAARRLRGTGARRSAGSARAASAAQPRSSASVSCSWSRKPVAPPAW